MRKLLVILGVTAFFLSACSVAFVPKQTPGGTINTKTHALSEQTDQVRITARVENADIAPYQIENPLSALHLTIHNLSGQEVSFPLSVFVLIDAQGNQYRPVAPGKIQKLVSRNSAYLIPYPYVGYYYLGDSERSSFANTFDSSLPFYAQNHPQDIALQSLPEGFILPGTQISGLLYFPVDLTQKKSFELRVYPPGRAAPQTPAFRFPFSVEK